MDEDEANKPGSSLAQSNRGRSVDHTHRRFSKGTHQNPSHEENHTQNPRRVSVEFRGSLAPSNRGRSVDHTHRRFSKGTHQNPSHEENHTQNPRSVSRDVSQERHHGWQRNGNSSNYRSRGGTQRQHNNRYRSMGFVTLERIATSNTSDILLHLNEHKEGFMDVLNSPIHRLDMIALIFEVFSKVSQSPFEELKSKLFLDVCNSNFISCLRNYLTDLPYTLNKTQNNMYWKDQNKFWQNFITFCRDIVHMSPATAVRTCRALIESVSMTCLEQLKNKHAFVLAEEDKLRLEELRNKMIQYADKREVKINNVDTNTSDVDMKPPEDFRELSVIPTREDLLDAQPFLRPNIVDGAYSDVEHYLDVQFRLLREDCYGPIRVGVNQYLADPTKRKYDHVRIFRNVKFVGPYITNLKVGTLVQIDIESNKFFKKINWANSKRLLFGSLLLFTKNNFSDFIVATILDRDSHLISIGKLAVTIIDSSSEIHLRHEDGYTMIESEVYFEPYSHLLKALQSPAFAQQLPMQQYIVKVDPTIGQPAYLTTDTEFVINDKPQRNANKLLDNIELVFPETPKIKLLDNIELVFPETPKIKFTVLKPETWPTKEQLKLNTSQYEAYELALTHEFAVIQGPPGTGKTYVGLNVAKTLLQNIKSNQQCLMLVICYTNHALDQFLVEISHVTQALVRIGGQSRNKEMDKYNITNLRKSDGRGSRLHNFFIDTKTDLKQCIGDFQETLVLLDILNHGVVDTEIIEVPQIQSLLKYYEQFPSIENPLMHWLFSNKAVYRSDFNQCLNEYQNLTFDNNDNEYNKTRTDYNIVLDDDKDRASFLEQIKGRLASFLITDAKLNLRNLVLGYSDPKISFRERLDIEKKIIELNSMINLYEDMEKYRSREIHLNITDNTEFLRIAPQTRWRLYFMWIKPLIDNTKKKIAEFQKQVSPLVTAYEETRMIMDLELIKSKNIKVLGMTTSAAARMRKLLNAVSPKILIVEEAAEVLEQHIITSLTKDCQHIILIGDHQQLKPSASYIKLAKQYNIEVSLFERMITNGIHSRRLKVQHRMRPEIAALISPHIYPDLENHPSVENLGDVPGVEKSVFFFTHNYQEELNINDGNSRANHKEADLTLAFANYLIQQGYRSDEVTILAAYSGQMFYMRKERQHYACLNDVKITVVDNYQGEESRIILLSLVRNNPDNIIGFLGTENRICVALSRAKQGFFMFGNMDMLKGKSELWRKIAATLESTGSLGTVLNLKCQVHPHQITPVVAAEDFNKVPEGGCLLKCNYQYNCGHSCLLYCHGYDRAHDRTLCTEQCERILCDLGHVCPLKCRETCGKCKVYLLKTLPCGHEMNVYCHREPEDPRIKCSTNVDVVLPNCNHKAQKQCHMDITKVKCSEKCKQRIEKCGHVCERLCHVTYPDHDDYICLKMCTKKNKGCMAEVVDSESPHQCMKKCYEECNDCNVQVMKKRSNCKHVAKVACCEDIDKTPCKNKCARSLACGHFCKNKCFEPCGDCKIMVTKVIPDCNHKVKIECHVTAEIKHCTAKCNRTLPCGHPCMANCSANCDQSNCKKKVSTEVDSPCGHKVKLPCNIYTAFLKGEIQEKKLMEYCEEPCGMDLACEHICGGTCSQCYQGRLHAPCKQTCNQRNICGHQCQEPCNQICPPCNMLCEVECQHSRCGRICGEPCVECKEKCGRRCMHGACTRLCSEECSCAACGEACPLALACGHRCRGVCGEPCPDICRDCRPDTFPTDFLGDDYGEDDKFILLQDCGHVLELENMDNLMMGDQENIQIRQCPFCRKPIINTNRYKDLVNKMLKNDINPIKEKVYGKNTEIEKKIVELRTKLRSIYLKVYQGNMDWQKAVKHTISVIVPKKKPFLLQVEMLLVYCEILEIIVECWQTYQNLQSTILEEKLIEHITIILKVLKIDFKSKVPIKICEQQQKDIGNEIKRLNTIIQFAKLLQNSGSMRDDSRVKTDIEAAKKEVFTLFVFNEDKAVECLMKLQSSMKSSTEISKMERQMIVKAMELKAGHWFKCPNGHFYCIDRCGGAMEVSKCPECGEAIGGTNHALLGNNAHAPEMDGSKFAAYSEEANNMANFVMEF